MEEAPVLVHYRFVTLGIPNVGQVQMEIFVDNERAVSQFLDPETADAIAASLPRMPTTLSVTNRHVP